MKENNLFIGVDLGTSAVKLILMDCYGKIYRRVSKEYPIAFPQPGWSEQNPQDWEKAVFEGIRELVAPQNGEDRASEVCGISFGGQMHGLVILDDKDEVIRPAILWNDGRTTKECAYLNETVGREKLSRYTANIAFAGFTAPKLLWLKANEPEHFAAIRKIMLPKDYISYCLTGIHATDYSDASGMLLLDVQNRCWSKEMLAICGVNETQLPKLYESYESIGTLTVAVAQELGLPAGTVVAAGAGDNAAAAVGTGTVGDGQCNISVGTSGTVFISSERFRVDENNALHAFAHADGRYHLMGCMLSAASCNQWWMDKIMGSSDYDGAQAAIKDEMLGCNQVYFLPYLMGERSPHNNPLARGTFTGMTLDTDRTDMLQAVLEGVAFAIRDSFEVAGKLGISVQKTKICGGGAKSRLWCRIISNVLGIPVEIPAVEEGPALGAAMLAMVACGAYDSVADAAGVLVKVREIIQPDTVITERYEQCYQKFVTIYPALKGVFGTLGCR